MDFIIGECISVSDYRISDTCIIIIIINKFYLKSNIYEPIRSQCGNALVDKGKI